MVVDNTFDLTAHIALASIENVVIDQGHLFDRISRRKLRPELIVKVQVFEADLTVGKVFHDLCFTVEVCAITVDHWNPLLAQLLLVVEGKCECSDS